MNGEQQLACWGMRNDRSSGEIPACVALRNAVCARRPMGTERELCARRGFLGEGGGSGTKELGRRAGRMGWGGRGRGESLGRLAPKSKIKKKSAAAIAIAPAEREETVRGEGCVDGARDKQRSRGRDGTSRQAGGCRQAGGQVQADRCRQRCRCKQGEQVQAGEQMQDKARARSFPPWTLFFVWILASPLAHLSIIKRESCKRGCEDRNGKQSQGGLGDPLAASAASFSALPGGRDRRRGVPSPVEGTGVGGRRRATDGGEEEEREQGREKKKPWGLEALGRL